MSASGSIGKFLWKNKGNAFNLGMGVWAAASTFQDEKEQGSSTLSAAASAGMDLALPMMMSAKGYIGLQLVKEAPELLYNGWKAGMQYRHNLWKQNRNNAFNNAKFDDTQQTYTMRQAGMAIAQRSRYNTQQAMLGNEAKYMMK